MYLILSLLILTVLYFLINNNDPTIQKSNVEIVPEITTSIITEATTEITSSNFVYITKTGNKYHNPECHYIKNSNTLKTTVTEATALGYTPCSECFK